MTNLQKIEQYIKDNIETVDLEVVSTKSMGGKALFRASIDKVTGGNLITSGFEYSLEDALDELVKELDSIGNKLTEKLV